MERKKLAKFIPLCIMLSLLTWGCAQNTATLETAAKPAVEQKQEANDVTGKVIGKSNKAKTISIEVGTGDKAKTMMVRFDDKTTGLEHAAPGEMAIVSFETRGDEKYATVIKPKLAKLPEGVAEIKTDELMALIEGNEDFTLIDSRPAGRYNQAHLPGAISLPVPKLEAAPADVLPEDKNKLLVFYCGGYT